MIRLHPGPPLHREKERERECGAQYLAERNRLDDVLRSLVRRVTDRLVGHHEPAALPIVHDAAELEPVECVFLSGL